MDRKELERQRTERDLRDVIQKCKALLPADAVRPDDSPALRNLDTARMLACLGLVQLGGGDLAGAMSINASAWKAYSLAMNQAAEPLVNAGIKASNQRQKAGFSSGEQRQAERAPEWEKWQDELDRVHAANPRLKKTAVQSRVAKKFGVSRTSIGNRTTWPEKN